jgi:hypothetical protein
MDTLKIYSSNRLTIYQLYAYTLLNSLFFIDLWARLYIKQKQISRLEFDGIGALVVIDRSHLFGSFTVSSRKNLLLLPLVAEHGAHESDRTKTHRDQTLDVRHRGAVSKQTWWRCICPQPPNAAKSTPKSRQQQHALVPRTRQLPASIGRYLRDTNLQRMAHLQVTTGFVHTPCGGYE